jgi:serine protease Do
MSIRRPSFFYGLLIAVVSLVVGMVIASRLDLTPGSLAGTIDVPATNSAPLSGPIDSTTFRNIARDAAPAVVTIQTETKQRLAPSIGRFFGLQEPDEDQTVQSAGSGFVVDKAGFILTNNHVVENATRIEVVLPSATSADDALTAKIVGRDVLTDSALLQLTEAPKTELVAVKFGDSSQIAPGDWVMAIGSPFRLSSTVTVGVVSAVGRTAPELRPAPGRDLEMIQTDAAINRGNSGGPLLNIRGEVVGINTAIFSDQTGGNLGIGFAVPINTVNSILPQLRLGKVVRGRIGVSVQSLTKSAAESLGLPNTDGAIVSLVSDGPAKDAGIQLEDVITEFNGKPVKSSNDVVSMVTRTTPGTTVPVKVFRDRKMLTLNVKVGELDLDAERDTLAGRRPSGRQSPGRPQETAFGMSIEDITPATARDLEIPRGRTGAVVRSVDPSGPAAQQGIRPGDLIVRINGQEVANQDQASRALDAVQTGGVARVVTWRAGQETVAFLRRR